MTGTPQSAVLALSEAQSGLLQAAAEARRAGDFARAAALCDQVLAHAPGQPDALRLKGLAAFAEGRVEAAIGFIGQAAAARPGEAGMHADLGMALARAGQGEAALAAYDQALALAPGDAVTHFNRANLLASQGRLQEAVADYDLAVEAAPAYGQAWTNRGAALSRLGRLDAALESHGRAAVLSPQEATTAFNLAAALQAVGRIDDALAAYAEAARLDPRLAAAHAHRAELFLALGRPEDALQACGRGMAADPGHIGLWGARGSALLALGRPLQALAAFDQVVARAPDFPPGHANRGLALRELGRLDEALAAFELTMALAPDYLEARCNQAICQLLAGDFGPGFEGHELRWRIGPGLADRRPFEQPLWLGAEDVAGRTILLHAEQGFGDTINFCRYAAPLAARGARVVLEVQPALMSVMAGLEGVSELVARGDPLPAFDLHCPLMSLPAAFATRLDTIPAAPAYLSEPEDRQALWAERLGPAPVLRVGVVWSGKPTHHNDRNRSIPLERFLGALPQGVEVVSLQERVREADEAALAAHPRIRRFDGMIGDFGDTAALAAAMDLVVSVDTSAAHLAAAMGRPTWILLPFAPDWRWLTHREDSPWYPSARLFRQPALGDWDSVLAGVREELERLAAG